MTYLYIGLSIGLLVAVLVYVLQYKQLQQLHAENILLKKDAENLLQLKADNVAKDERLSDLRNELTELKNKIDGKEAEIQQYIKDTAKYKSDKESLEEKLDTQKTELQTMHLELNKEFKLLANEIIEEKTRKFSEVNEEKIGNILNPLKEKILLFEKKVDETYSNEIREKATLRKELEQIMDINRQMSDDAQKLTSALKGDSKIQGDWGEVQLEMLLEKSGLQRDIHFFAQANYKTESGTNVRPDFIINLPDGKNFIIDSKVSLTAYERYYNAEDDAQRTIALKEHLISIQQHMTELGAKNYPNLYGINSPDFVFLFVPIEPALTLALQSDLSLFDKALAKNVVLVSGSTLLATMRTVSFIWKQENQKNNVLEIAKESGALYDKFVGMTEDLLKMGVSLAGTQKTYEDAMNKFVESQKRGDTVIGRMERIKKLGANTTKNIDKRLLDKVGVNEEQLPE